MQKRNAELRKMSVKNAHQLKVLIKLISTYLKPGEFIYIEK